MLNSVKRSSKCSLVHQKSITQLIKMTISIHFERYLNYIKI